MLFTQTFVFVLGDFRRQSAIDVHGPATNVDIGCDRVNYYVKDCKSNDKTHKAQHRSVMSLRFIDMESGFKQFQMA